MAFKTSRKSYDHSRFSATSDFGKDIFADIDRLKKPTFAIASSIISYEGAQLGYVLSRICNRLHGDDLERTTYFTNSTLDAIFAVIRLARETANAFAPEKPAPSDILILDEKKRFRHMLAGSSGTGDGRLYPGLYHVSDPRDPLLRQEGHWAAIIHIRSEAGGFDAQWHDFKTIAQSQSFPPLFALCTSEITPGSAEFLRPDPETQVTIFGENAGLGQIPFGAFSMTPATFSIWNDPAHDSVFASTYAGNTVALRMVLGGLRKLGLVSPEDETILARISSTPEDKLDYFARHVSASKCASYKAYGNLYHIRRAEGVKIWLESGEELIDGQAGFGVSLRGHNPDGIADVLQDHDPEHDYLTDLEAFICERSDFSHFIPAVSGATAVDNALRVATMARPGKPVIVTFAGNYSGKNLLSVNASRTSVALRDRDWRKFAPQYPHMIFIDPDSPAAAEQLQAVLDSGTVALVWFELLQNYMCRRIPDQLLAIVQRSKARNGYLIGVDEVMTAFWRTSSTPFMHQDYIEDVDLMSMSKALADMRVPIGGTMVAQEAYASARSADPEHFDAIAQHYAFNLGAHIALNGLTRAEAAILSPQTALVRSRWREGLDRIASRSEIYDHVAGAGVLVRFALASRHFPFANGARAKYLAEAAVSRLIAVRGGLLTLSGRLFMPIVMDLETVEEFLRRLAEVVEPLRPVDVYKFVLDEWGDLIDDELRSQALLVVNAMSEPVD